MKGMAPYLDLGSQYYGYLGFRFKFIGWINSSV